MSPKLLNILFIITPVVLYIAVIQPLYTGQGPLWVPANSIKNLKTMDSQYSSTLAQITKIEQETEKIYQDYAAIDQKVKDDMAILLSEKVDPVKLRNEIVTMANKVGIEVTNLKVVKDKKGYKGLDFYIVTFDTKARYPVFKELMTLYDRNMRFFVPESIKIKRQEDKGNGEKIFDKEAMDISVSLRVHYMP